MKALLLNKICNLNENNSPLQLKDIPAPVPLENEILIKVHTCGVCHTELDEIEGRTPPPVFPIVLGHRVVGKVIEKGNRANKFKIDNRVGVGWKFSSCGSAAIALKAMIIFVRNSKQQAGC